MKPQNLVSKIFLDSGDPQETKQVITKLGWLDGQTTNPSLFAKNPEVVAALQAGRKYTQAEIYQSYKKIIQDISSQIPAGSISVEVYADNTTTTEQMVNQAKEMNVWIPNAHIKLPVTQIGLEAAYILVKEGIRVNLTLCFSQEQAAAVHAATRGAYAGQVYLSPFVGRFDDRGENGMDIIQNIQRMFQEQKSHVQIIAASVRTYGHLLASLQLGIDIITAPAKVLIQWAENNYLMPDNNWIYPKNNLTPITYQDVSLDKNWQEYNIQHDLTDQGLVKFLADWNKLL